MTRTYLSKGCAAAALCMAMALSFAAMAQHTDSPPPRKGTVMNGAERGSHAAGRGVTRADNATRRGVANVSERASRPVRNVGESIGRKLPGGSRHPAPPPVGPQSTTPSPG
ncbi:hypothetical protein ACSFA2_18270 [Variovorax sp. LT2P21]|uniref:hypothetical protein n=1 Tax=Variovorax sp. LT2P21 TaxID=3443731 RepID=UPI003F482C99